VILGGQLLSLFLSLLITPVAYSLWDDIAGMIGRMFRRRNPSGTQSSESGEGVHASVGEG